MIRMSLALLVATAATLGANAEDKVHPLEPFYGTWKGTAVGIDANRQPFELTQTERVGPMLGGDVAVIEGRGYEAGGALAFNAFAVVSCDAPDAPCEMRSYTDGRTGTFALEATETGFVWTIPAGPEARIVYTATLEDGIWTEVGHYHPATGEPVETFRMELTRIGDTDWPAGGAVTP